MEDIHLKRIVAVEHRLCEHPIDLDFHRCIDKVVAYICFDRYGKKLTLSRVDVKASAICCLILALHYKETRKG